MSSYKVQLTGLNQVQKITRELSQSVKTQVVKAFKEYKENVVRDAKLLVPVNEAHLITSISGTVEESGNNIETEIHVASDYAAFVEFGTRSFAERYVSSLPSDWQTFAAQFKGKGGGSFADMIKKLVEWVRHKGLGSGHRGTIGVTGTYSIKTRKRTGSKSTQEKENQQAAYLIALSILRKGSRAHPFLYPAVENNKKDLITALNNMKFT